MPLRQGSAQPTKWQGTAEPLLHFWGSAPQGQANMLRLVALLAGEAGGAIDIARSLVDGLFGVGTQGTRRLDARRCIASHKTGGDDLIWGDAFLDPLLNGADHVVAGIVQSRRKVAERCCADAASAMGHSRDHEEAIEILGSTQIALASGLSHYGLHSLKIIDAVLRRDRGVAPAVILNQLSAECFELCKVRVGRVQNSRGPVVGCFHIAVKVESTEIPFRVVKNHVGVKRVPEESL